MWVGVGRYVDEEVEGSLRKTRQQLIKINYFE